MARHTALRVVLVRFEMFVVMAALLQCPICPHHQMRWMSLRCNRCEKGCARRTGFSAGVSSSLEAVAHDDLGEGDAVVVAADAAVRDVLNAQAQRVLAIGSELSADAEELTELKLGAELTLADLVVREQVDAEPDLNVERRARVCSGSDPEYRSATAIDDARRANIGLLRAPLAELPFAGKRIGPSAARLPDPPVFHPD